jgi:DNA-directed RNA polymerase specialized sigma24 family protein
MTKKSKETDPTERKLDLTQLTEHQRRIWKMRYQYRWRLRQIALELGTSRSTVCRVLQLARVRAGVPRGDDVSVIRRKPRLVRAVSLSVCFNY